MQRIFFIVILFITLLCACFETKPELVTYNDTIVSNHYKIELALDSLAGSIEAKDIVEIEKKYYDVQRTIDKATQEIEQLPVLASDSVFRKSFMAYCKSYVENLAMFVPSIKKSYNIPDKNYTIAKHSILESSIRDFNHKRATLIYKLEIAQENFARKHNLVISSSENHK